MTTQPDILFIVLDTQRADRLSCYGFEHETSPNLDALAADATRFAHAYTAAQWTVPSHSSMFTGTYPPVHRTQQSFDILPESLPTLAERLRDAGYFTEAYCNNPLVGIVNNGLRRGFISFMNYSGLLTSRPNQAGMRPPLMGRYRQFFKRHLSGFLHRVQDSFARSDALLAFAFTPFMVPIWQTALSFKGNSTKSLNDAAKVLIDRKGLKPDQPAFCFINLMGTHMPFHPDRQYMEEYAPAMVHDRAAQRYMQRFNGDVLGWLTPSADKMTPYQRELMDGMYNAEVATQDRILGAFLERLRSSGVLDKTMVVICADHGEHLGEKHFVGHTVSLYQELTHVPLIIRDPDQTFPRGAVRDEVVSLRRLYQTVLAAAGVATPEEEAYSLAVPPEDDPDKGMVFAEATTPQNVLNLLRKQDPDLVEKHAVDQRRVAIWRKPYKLILTGAKQRELYNFLEDPQEQVNLVDELPAIAAELSEEVRLFLVEAAEQAATPGVRQEEADPQVAERLRALGYLE